MAIRRTELYGDLNLVSEIVPLYQELCQVKRQIDDIMPRFEDQLFCFESEMEKSDPVEGKVLDARHEAMAARDTLMLLFRHLEGVARKIKTNSEGRLGGNVHRAALLYLQNNMFTLQMLPRLDMRRLQKPVKVQSEMKRSASIKSESSSIFSRFLWRDSALPSPLPELPIPANLFALQEKMDVLLEQRAQLEGFIAGAARSQRFDDLCALRLSLEDVNREITRTRRILDK
jgi:hypothetical protein